MVENRSRPNDWNLRCRHTIRVVFSFSPVCLAVLVYCVETGFQFWLNLVGSSVLCHQSSVCQLFTFFCSPCDNPRPVIQFLLLRKLMKNRTKPSVWLFEYTQLNLVWFWVSFTFCRWVGGMLNIIQLVTDTCVTFEDDPDVAVFLSLSL